MEKDVRQFRLSCDEVLDAGALELVILEPGIHRGYFNLGVSGLNQVFEQTRHPVSRSSVGSPCSLADGRHRIVCKPENSHSVEFVQLLHGPRAHHGDEDTRSPALMSHDRDPQ